MKESYVDVGDLIYQMIQKASRKEECEFLKEFSKTQMFVTLVEDFFSK